MVLKLSQSRVGPEIATEVVSFVVAEVVKPDLVNVCTIGGLGDVHLTLFDELLWVVIVDYFPRLYGGGHRPLSSSRINFMAGGRVLSFVGVACMRTPH